MAAVTWNILLSSTPLAPYGLGLLVCSDTLVLKVPKEIFER
jgi:hypothetical protein